MSKKPLFVLWGILFIVCAACGFIPEPAGALRVLLTALSVSFFLPPALLLYRSGADSHTRRLIGMLSGLSLGLTLILLVLNFLSVFSVTAAGTLLYYMLVMISSPMVCSGYWALSLFLWACLLMASLTLLKKEKAKG